MALEVLDHIRLGWLWKTSDQEAIRIVAKAFVPELAQLQMVPASIEQSVNGSTKGDDSKRPTPSQLLYDHDYDEVNRTLTSFLCLKWIISGDHTKFTSGQASSVALSLSTFQSLRSLILQRLDSVDDYFALVTAIIVNDLGKDPRLAHQVENVTSRSMHGENHDFVLYEAVRADMVHCLRSLPESQREALVIGLKMGTRLNLGQLAQAENVPGSLDVMLELRGRKYAFELKFIEQFLDVAGAAGHIDSSCSKSMIEPVCQAFLTIRQVLTDILEGRSTLRQGYDDVLTQRAAIISANGFRNLDVHDDQDRALLRLMTMGRTSTKQQALWFEDAFSSLTNETRSELIRGLNVDGYKDGKAILPYYMPALLQAALKNTPDESGPVKTKALASLMRFLVRVLDGTYPHPGSPGTVVEHDLEFAKKTIAGPEFKADPTVLDGLELTKAGAQPQSLHI